MRKDPKSYIRLDQLLTKEGFLRSCRLDYHSNIKLDINKDFLDAAEKDGFLKPLTKVKGYIKTEGGKELEVMDGYYSPHQIYIVASLYRNIAKEGRLYSKYDLEQYIQEQQKRQPYRFVAWGWEGLSMNIGLAKEGGGHHPTIPDIFDYCEDFHSFLVLLHTFQTNKHEVFDRQKMRLFNDAPQINFDFSPLKKTGEKGIRDFGLNIKKLRMLRKTIGEFALQIDPLEFWYPYIRRHPRVKKDLLKGDGQLAQEMYIIHDLLVELLEILTGLKEPELFDTLYQGRPLPMLLSKSEYAHGTDLMAMWSAIKKFRSWAKGENNEKFVPSDTLERLVGFEKDIKAYEAKYGDRSYVSGLPRPVEYEEKLGIKDLDLEVAKYVEQILKQDNEQIFIKDQIEMKQLIAEAINSRLDSLKRKLWAILDEAHQELQKEVSKNWDAVHIFGNYFWSRKGEELRKLSREQQLKKYSKEEQLVRDEAIRLSQIRDGLDENMADMQLIFCQKCRKRPVVIHSETGDQIFYDSFICDVCMKNPDEIRKTKLGEWRCYACGEILYKFNYENKLIDYLTNGVKFKIELEYGRFVLTAKCKKCGEENLRPIDWGWAL